jgi:hypothetical protein
MAIIFSDAVMLKILLCPRDRSAVRSAFGGDDFAHLP